MKLKSKIFRSIAALLLVSMLSQIFYPTVSYALTSGPSQPEIQSFEPATTTDMVDLFSGDFNYNIPLFELPGPNGGYPFNLAYHAGITHDQEASWTGLGWNINPGAINRQMRGLPDEWDGTQSVITEMDIKPNVTFGIGGGVNAELFGSDKLTGGIGLKVYYNNYRGIGYGLNLGASFHGASQTGMTGGLNLGVSLDSQEGVGANASIALSSKGEKAQNDFSLGIGYNSLVGLSSLTLDVSRTTKKDAKGSDQKITKGEYGSPSVISLAATAYTPQMGMSMQGRNMTLSFKAGIDAFNITGTYMLNGFFSTQYIGDASKYSNSPAYGYMGIGKYTMGSNAMMDFNREKDGMIYSTSPNLAMPSATFDIYSVTGQGMGGMFRPFRRDAGTFYDPLIESVSAGGSLSVELATVGLSTYIGVDIDVNYSSSRSGNWTGYSDGFNRNFEKETSGFLSEPVYMKSYGELTIDDVNETNGIGDDVPTAFSFTDKYNGVVRHRQINPAYQTPGIGQDANGREPRNNAITPINGSYANGISTVNADGVTYVYGKPVNNESQIETVFSTGITINANGNNLGNFTKIVNIEDNGGKPKYKHPGAEYYYNKKSLNNPFPYTYLLTAVLGTDYIDADNNGIPSDGDFGYWVKFCYTSGDDYNWRAPFSGANFLPGKHTTPVDNKGVYMFGRKKICYLASAETKSHKAFFTISPRADARGALNEIQNNSEKGAYSKKLDKIELYSKNQAGAPTKLLKSVYFEYSYDLAKGLPNNDVTIATTGYKVASVPTLTPIVNNGGKLTLKKVWFTYENNSRGSLSPYEFDYKESDPGENPGYNASLYDRWGNHNPNATLNNRFELPYVKQDEPLIHKNMAVWNLKEITLPSGGKIKVEYEADDYGYVQDKVAMQMFDIVSTQPVIYGANPALNPNKVGDNDRRIYFKLKNTILKSASETTIANEMSKYKDNTGDVYFKIYSNLRPGLPEYVSGYARLSNIDVDRSTADPTNYTHGYVVLEAVEDYHPFCVAAWQHMRTNAPESQREGNFNIDINSQKAVLRQKGNELISMIPEIKKIFVGFKKYASLKSWGSSIDLSKSVIRLCTPDKKKYGGGHRVKQITLSDEWNVLTANASETKSVYGQVYEYTTTDNDGQTIISSGVAGYEPLLGGDEIPHRLPKKYVQQIPLKTDNNLFFEYPINESYFPGADVGYRKVTMKSLATYYEGQTMSTGEVFPLGIMTTGKEEHEFFTAKEFPVITQETNIDLNTFKLPIPVPLIGSSQYNHITAGQGYSISLNNMHGKLRKVSKYAQDKTRAFLTKPDSYIEYYYKSTQKTPDLNHPENYFVLDNIVPTMGVNQDGKIVKYENTMRLGQDHEFYVDMREHSSKSTSGGMHLNLGIDTYIPLVLVAVMPWPSFSYSSSMVRTAVTNKIIHKAGILMATQAFQDGSLVRTENKYFSAHTGEPVLTITTNNFDDPVFDYKAPGYFAYNSMGQAFQNLGYKFSATYNGPVVGKNYSFTVSNISFFVPGDEISLDGTSLKGVIVNKVSNTLIVSFGTNSIVNGPYNFTITRSGRRNILSATIGNIKALTDPTVELAR